MQVRMQNVEPLTEVQIGEFLRGSQAIEFAGQSRAEVYAVVQECLVRQEYFRQGKKQRGAIRAYLAKLTGRSLPQMTRLIRQQKANGEIRLVQRTRRRFATRYTDTDVGLLADVDRAHERLNGPSTRRISAAGVRGVWQKRVRAAGGDLGVTYLQPETKSGISEQDSGLRVHKANRRLHRRAETAEHERKIGRRNRTLLVLIFRITLYWKRFHVSGSFYDWKMLEGGSRDSRYRLCRTAGGSSTC